MKWRPLTSSTCAIRTNGFEGIGAHGPQDINLTGDGEPERLNGELVTANVLSILGVEPALGRTFLANEDQPGQHRVVVLSDALWQRRFNRDPSIVNRNIILNGESFTVVGVMPRGFFFPVRETELWVPWAMEPEQASGRGDHYLRLVARLKPGATLQQANAEVDSIGQRLATEYPRTNEGLSFIVNSLASGLRRRSSLADPDHVCRCRTGAPDRVRQRCKPAVGPGNNQTQRDRDTNRAGRASLDHRAAIAD